MSSNIVPGAGPGRCSSGSAAFLESTRTNVIVLQNLEGLCWRRYTLAPVGYGLPKNAGQQHALLDAFTHAIEAGYAATVVHRSSHSGTQSPHFGNQMDQQVDLYVFWQGQKGNTMNNNISMNNNNTPCLELPAPLAGILSSITQTKVLEEGCWDWGMSYAVRCLLMKATNCLVQAQLARGGYHRIGRYFVRTYSPDSSNSQQQQQQQPYSVAFTLNYFVHGDGRQLCAFINARRRPPLVRLTAQHLANAPENTNVILCPFGLSGYLTGRALSNQEANDFLTLFARTCPVVPSSDNTGLPSVVEVAIADGAVHTFYPAHSLLVVKDGKSNRDMGCEQQTNPTGDFRSSQQPRSSSVVPPMNSSPQQRRVPHTPKSTSSGGLPSRSPGANILDLMSSGTDVTTHPIVLPSPNCACTVSLTGKRTNTNVLSTVPAAKRPSFHRSCHLKAEEAVPSPLLPLSTQTSDEMSLLFPLSVTAPTLTLPVADTSDECRSTISTNVLKDEALPVSAAVTAAPTATAAGPPEALVATAVAQKPGVPGATMVNGQLSPTGDHEIMASKMWPSSHDRDLLKNVATNFAAFGKMSAPSFFAKSHAAFQNDISYTLTAPFSRYLTNPQSRTNDDLVSLFGYDSLSCLAELSPAKTAANALVLRHNDSAIANNAITRAKVAPHSKTSQVAQSSLAVLLDSPDICEPMSVDRNLRGDGAGGPTTLEILATLGNTTNRLGSELPENIFDVDSDASEDNSPGGAVASAGTGNSAPNSLDAHFPTPPTSVETNAPPSLRGLTPATAAPSDTEQQLIQHNQQQLNSKQMQRKGDQVNVEVLAFCEGVFHPDASGSFIEGERYRPLSLQSTSLSGGCEDLVNIGRSDKLVSLKSLRHEPSTTVKSPMGTPTSQRKQPLQQQQNQLPSLTRDQPLSPLSFLNSLMGSSYSTTAGGQSIEMKPATMETNNNNNNFNNNTANSNNNRLSPPDKDFEVLQPDNLISLLLAMSDSVLDIHRDVNFDMAPLCACTNSPLRGIDWPAYLRPCQDSDDASMNTDFGNSDAAWPAPIADCSCGYSAVANRRVAAYGCGMLHDDERELLSSSIALKKIMSYSRNDAEYKNLEPPLVRLFQKMCSVASPSVPFVNQVARLHHPSEPWTGSRSTPASYLKKMAKADKNCSLPLCRCRSCFADAVETNSFFASTLEGFLESVDIDDEGFFFHNWINTGACYSPESSCSTSELFGLVTQIHPLLLSTLRHGDVPSGQSSSSSHSKRERELIATGEAARAGTFSTGIPPSSASNGSLFLKSLFESVSDPVATAVPIPFVMASCEKEAIQLAPTALGPCWERNGLEPVAGAGRRLCYLNIRPLYFAPDSNFEDEEQIEYLALKYFTNEIGRVMVDCRLASVHTQLVDLPFSGGHKVPRLPVIVDSVLDASPATPNRAAKHVSAQRDWLRSIHKFVVDSLTDREQVESSYDGCVVYVAVRDQAVAAQVLRVFSQLMESLPSDDFRERVVLQMIPTSYAALSWSGAQSAVQAEIRRFGFSIYTQLGCRWRLDRGERALTDTGPLPLMRDIILTESRLAAAASDRKLAGDRYSPESATGLWDGPLRWPYSPVAVLARLKDQQTRLAECCGQRADTTVVVFAAYCPTPDQRYLLVSLTDDCGYLVKTGVLALEQPETPADQRPPSAKKKHNKPSRLRPPVARAAIELVWCWLLGAITHSALAVPIRLVLTRLGRLGHGEVRTWSALLSRQSLMQMSGKLQSACSHCQALPSSEVPCVISSSLISLEPHPWLRLLASTTSTPVAIAVSSGAGLGPDVPLANFTGNGGDYRPSGKVFACTGSTAHSSTHVFAFPTSAAIQAQTQATVDEAQDGGEWDLLFPVDIDVDKELIVDIPTVPSPSASGGPFGFDDLGGFGGLPGAVSQQPASRMPSSGGGWPRQSISGPGGASDRLFGSSTANFFGVDSTGAGPGGGAAACGLLQQPLAVAFVVSAAPLGPAMPDWLSTILRNAGNNEAAEEKSKVGVTADKPTSLRAALYVHTASILPTAGGAAGGLGATGSTSGSAAASGSGGTGNASGTMAMQEHPLDSRRTVDVLRYAVEEHDALSWLAVDPATGQRTSCLPPHIVALLNLHHMLQAFSR